MKIALLISGGVDSSVACFKLVEAGIVPDLWYIKIGSDKEETLTCTAEEDIEMATAVAHKFGLKLNVIDLHNEYWDNVTKYTMDKVKLGLTPNPDVMCNQLIKFGAFIDKVGKNYDRIATGHYGTIWRGDNPNKAVLETLDNYKTLTGKFWLGSAVDEVKDQTDFLCTLSEYQLSKLMLPIGNLHKSEVREIAEREKLVTAKRKDSQGICFLGKINYNDYVKMYLGEKEGDIVDWNHTSKVLGKHKGYWFHTIGQRKGLGLSGGPWYVVKKDIDKNIVYVTNNKKNLNKVLVRVTGIMWSNDYIPDVNLKCQVRIRHNSPMSKAIFHNGFKFFKTVDEPLRGVAPGQFCVIYDAGGKIVLGSAEITI